MENILNFCQANKDLVFTIMVVLVIAVTQLCKLPIKHFTKNMPKAKKDAINGTITAIAVIMGFIVEAIYSVLTGSPFNASIGGTLGALGAGSYNFYEFFRNIFVYIQDCRKNHKKVTGKGIIDVAKKSAKVDEQNNVADDIIKNFTDDIDNISDNE